MNYKTSFNQTGTLFYSKISDRSNHYRVRFKSFQLSFLQNQNKITDLDNMQTKYNLFKNGKTVPKRFSMEGIQDQKPDRNYKNLRDREKESLDLRGRLKSMKQTRKTLFQKIKTIKQP